MKIDKPIFIVGSGRSGTTLLYNLLSTHPEVGWFSNLTDRIPQLPTLAAVHRLLELPWLGTVMKQHIVQRKTPSLRPSEAENIYHLCGFEDNRKTTEEDLTSSLEKRFKNIIHSHLRSSGKVRFLGKQTANTQRIRMINKLFPDAYYIHIIRDGRAVASSLYKVQWWNDIVIWWLGDKSSKWRSTGRDPIELCALHWEKDVKEILQHKYLFEDRYLEIRYEELVNDPIRIVRKITDFSGLRQSKQFFQLIPQSLNNMNYKWEKNLTEPQKQVLQSSIDEFLTQLDYSS